MSFSVEVFCAGLERASFDNKTVSFEEHCNQEHNMWHYLYFIVLVRVKDPTEFTGPESYVNSMIKVRLAYECVGCKLSVPSATAVTLLIGKQSCMLTMWQFLNLPPTCCCCSNRLISPARLIYSSKPAATAGLLLWGPAGMDRWTHTVPFHRPCSAYCAGFYGFIEDVMLPTNTSAMNTILVNY